jgi:hypothetical protein
MINRIARPSSVLLHPQLFQSKIPGAFLVERSLASSMSTILVSMLLAFRKGSDGTKFCHYP